jgi:thiosulfate/3-mercaptopyruvate sulfurtransferase
MAARRAAGAAGSAKRKSALLRCAPTPPVSTAAAGAVASASMAVETSPIISIEELAGQVAGGDAPIIVDLRWYLGKPGAGRAAYLDGHIPGAIFLDLDDDLADHAGLGAPGRHPLPSPAAFTKRMAEAGLRDGARVVGYDDVGGWVAARLWWVLDNLGFGRRGTPGEWVRVLDGGIKSWVEAGLAVATGDEVPSPAPGGLHLGGQWHGVIEREELKGRLGDITLLDARGAPRYRGEVEPIDPVPGHIPTAISAPFDMNLAPDGRLRPAEELRIQYADLGITGDGDEPEAVVSCGSGTSAAHHSLAMRLAGLPDPILYVGSYSDWSRSGEPVATGPEPGPPPDRRVSPSST